jgi:hypothetical protein
MVVRETVCEVMHRVLTYRHSLLQDTPLSCPNLRQIDPRVEPPAQE